MKIIVHNQALIFTRFQILDPMSHNKHDLTSKLSSLAHQLLQKVSAPQILQHRNQHTQDIQKRCAPMFEESKSSILNTEKEEDKQASEVRVIDTQPNMTGRKLRKRSVNKYQSYTVSFKKNIVEQVRRQLELTRQPLYSILKAKALEYGLHVKNVARWYKLKEIKEREGGRKADYPQMQERLAQFIKAYPKAQRKQIIQAASFYIKDLKLLKDKQMQFSKGWYERFRARLRLKINEECEKESESHKKYLVGLDSQKIPNINMSIPEEQLSSIKQRTEP